MKVVYFDCFSGASGDMILGALISLGWPPTELEKVVVGLRTGNCQTIVEPVVKQGVSAIRVDFKLGPEPHERRLGDLLDIVAAGDLPLTVRRDADRVLRRLGEAEAKAHGIPGAVEEVRLHELGSFDTLFDVVGSVAGLQALAVDEILVSPLLLGGGTVHTQHGLLPVPGPAVAELVRGLPVIGGNSVDGELLTPTAAAIFTTLGNTFGPMPELIVERVGYGAGQKDGRMPNVLRAWIGERAAYEIADEVRLLESNIDDMNPEFYGPLMERLLRKGALDVFLTPVLMKKGRPGHILGVLCSPDQATSIEDVIFEETSTLGVRSSTLRRRKLERQTVSVRTRYGALRVKVGRRGEDVLVVAPEFEDCRDAAMRADVPVKAVYQEAQRAYYEEYGQ